MMKRGILPVRLQSSSISEFQNDSQTCSYSTGPRLSVLAYYGIPYCRPIRISHTFQVISNRLLFVYTLVGVCSQSHCLHLGLSVSVSSTKLAGVVGGVIFTVGVCGEHLKHCTWLSRRPIFQLLQVLGLLFDLRSRPTLVN